MRLLLSYLLTLLPLALADDSCPPPSPTPTPTSTPTSTPTPTPAPALPPFTLMALRSASPIHFSPIAASGLQLWIGKNTSTYCPTSASGAIPCASLDANVTAFFPPGDGLYAEVPGGQQVYAAADGALGYTQAHSAATPPGASVAGGTQTPPTAGQSFGYWTWTGGNATGLVACPSGGSGEAGTGPWQVFAAVAGRDFGRCLGFEAAAVPYDGPFAWQYA